VPDTRKNIRGILLNLLPAAASVAKLPTAQFVIDKFQVHRHLRGQAADKRQQRLPMRFTCAVKAKHSRPSLA
jgi:hypothetical protein